MNNPYFSSGPGSFNYGQPNMFSPQPTAAVQQNQDERIWVQNSQAAESYLLAANGFVRLWDASKPVFYEKRADATGRPFPMIAYEYKQIIPKSEAEASEATNIYTEKLEALEQRISALENAKRGTKNAKQHESNADDAES